MKLHFGVVVVVLVIILMGACTSDTKPEGTLTVTELLENPLYETEVKTYGKVIGLGELACNCFYLSSGGESMLIWYDTMISNDETLRPPVSVQGINNGDDIIVTGELKGEGGIRYKKGDFWATVIVAMKK